jgi:hypothetical protein
MFFVPFPAQMKFISFHVGLRSFVHRLMNRFVTKLIKQPAAPHRVVGQMARAIAMIQAFGFVPGR